jgi:hypothetical protein
MIHVRNRPILDLLSVTLIASVYAIAWLMQVVEDLAKEG